MFPVPDRDVVHATHTLGRLCLGETEVKSVLSDGVSDASYLLRLIRSFWLRAC
jgi:hypothetical protein